MRMGLDQVPVLVRFGAVGLAAAATHSAVFLVLVSRLGLAATGATVIAFGFAFAVSYLGQSRWTFRANERGGRLGRFLSASLLGLGLNTLAAWTIVDRLGWSPVLVLPFVIAIVPAIIFLLMRHWVFRQAAAGGLPP